MSKTKKKKQYSTLVIVNKNNPNTKSYTVPTKHISRLKYYLTGISLLFIGVIATLVIFIKKYNQNIAAEQELQRFKTEVAGPLATDTVVANAYIKRIDSKLSIIKKYLKQRGVKPVKLNAGGNNKNPNISAINTYRYYNIYLKSLIKNLKYMPQPYQFQVWLPLQPFSWPGQRISLRDRH